MLPCSKLTRRNKISCPTCLTSCAQCPGECLMPMSCSSPLSASGCSLPPLARVHLLPPARLPPSICQLTSASVHQVTSRPQLLLSLPGCPDFSAHVRYRPCSVFNMPWNHCNAGCQEAEKSLKLPCCCGGIGLEIKNCLDERQ